MRKIGALILAAGDSSRLGQSKQLLQFRGQTLLQRIVDAASFADCSPVAVVVGADRDRIVAALGQANVFIIENETWQRGIGNSIRMGLRELLAAHPDLDALILLACDQPLVDAETIMGLKAKQTESQKAIVASSYAGTLGIPALFSRVYFDELFVLDDETGAKQVILSHKDDGAEYSFSDGAVDIDTPADYKKLMGRGD